MIKMNKEKKVSTINNEELPISQCRKFEAGYYKIGDNSIENSGDCYLIGEKYYRAETNQVVYDNEVGQYVIKNDLITNGIIGFDKQGYTLGYFTMTNNNVIVHTPSNTYYAINEDLLSTTKLYRERLTNGEYYHIDMLDAREFGKISTPSQQYKTSLPYDSRGIIDSYKKIHDTLNIEISKNVKMFAPVLGDLSFGLEFETIAGFVPNRLLDKTGLIPLRDGSIAGLEYVTIPLSGEKGLQTVINAANVLKTRTTYDESCALHLHIGNIPRTKEFILAFFRTTCAIQEELFSLFPLYKKYNFGVKNKNYSKPFPIYELVSKMDPCINSSNINNNFDVLYTYLSMGQSFKEVGCDLRNVNHHPADPSDGAKWNIRTRYYNHNLIPLIFGNKATVEFRIHTPTFEVNKIIPFVFINSMIVNFVLKNQDQILTNPRFLDITLKNIVTDIIKNSKGSSLSTLHECLFSYIDTRKDYIEHFNREGNIKGNEKEIPICNYINWEAKEVTEKVKPIIKYGTLGSEVLSEFDGWESIVSSKDKSTLNSKQKW